MTRSPEGPTRSMLWTAFTHLVIALALVVGAGGLAHGFHQVTALPRRLLFFFGGVGAGGAFGVYLGRELGEPDPATNLGSVLDVLGALVGVLGGLWLLQQWGWMPL